MANHVKEDINNNQWIRRTVSLVGLACLTILISLYYMATEDSRRYLTLTSSISDHIFYDEIVDVSARKFLVNGPKCRIPDVNPYDKSIRRYLATVSHISCSKQQALTYITKTSTPNDSIIAILHVDKHMISSYSKLGVQCCYSNVTRKTTGKSPDDGYSISTCKNFNDSVNVTEEFVIVKCVTKNRKKEVYKSAHSIINTKSTIRERLQENNRNENSNNSRTLNVLMIGIDSISRLNFMRTMPRTREYLTFSGWTELKGYNKIADNTYPNLMAILTGIDGDKSYTVCHPKTLYGLDNCTFIWRKFQDNGYVTAYAEDAAQISTFNYNKLGFVHQPTDYYFRPYLLAIEDHLKIVKKKNMRYCIGPVSAGDRILSYAKDFATTFVNHSNFGFFWMNAFSHNDLNMPSSMDNVMLQFFEELADKGVNENSIIVFFSDHGMRFGAFRSTKIGWLEERLPFIYIYIPEWFKEKFPNKFTNLQTNANRLTTPYDLYLTLQDILVLSGKASDITPSSGCPNCKSLFTAIDNNRSCEDVAISPHWCMCTTFKHVPPDNSTVQQAANFVLHRIQKYIDDADANISKKCAKLRLSKIIKSEISESWYKKDTSYLLLIETIPGNGKYEATVSINTNGKTSNNNNLANMFTLHSSVSRLDSYADQSYCIDDAVLKKYCYCR